MSHWNWNNINSYYWQEPANEVYYYLYKWMYNEGTKNLLDLGAGIGRHSILFANHGFNVTAFDSSFSGLKQIEKNNNSNILTVLGDMSDLSFNDESFDYIIAFNSIYHTNRVGLKKIINELYRVTIKGGEVFLTMLSKYDQFYVTNSAKLESDGTIFKKEEDGAILPHVFVDYEEIRNIFAQFSLESIRHIETYHDNNSHCHFHIHLRKT